MKSRKKFLAVFSSLCMALVMVFSLVGCGGEEEESQESSKNNTKVENNDGEDRSSGENKLLGSSKMFASLQEYIDAQKDEIDAAIKQNEGSGMSMEVKADGDTLIYRYIYDEPIEVSEYVVDTFEAGLDQYKSQFDAILEEIEKYVEAEKPAVLLLYENPDGSLVFSCRFSGDGVETDHGAIAEGADSNGKMFASVQAYLDAQQDQIDEAVKAVEGSGMSMEIKADGDTLVYRYIYDETVPVDDDLTASFEAGLDTYQSQFDAVLAEMERLIDVTEPAVLLVYENPDGTVIYTHTFTK